MSIGTTKHFEFLRTVYEDDSPLKAEFDEFCSKQAHEIEASFKEHLKKHALGMILASLEREQVDTHFARSVVIEQRGTDYMDDGGAGLHVFNSCDIDSLASSNE